MIARIPKTVFVPFEWVGGAERWRKRDDLPRFLEPEEAVKYLTDNPRNSFRDGNPVALQWQERHEPELIKEYLQGVGVPRQ